MGCARWLPTAPGPGWGCWWTPCSGPVPPGRPGLPWRGCSSACSISSCPLVAVDGPTGVDLRTGTVHGAPRAELTVTFGGFRRGHLLARDEVGDVVVVDIGHPPPDPGVADAGRRRRCGRMAAAPRRPGPQGPSGPGGRRGRRCRDDRCGPHGGSGRLRRGRGAGPRRGPAGHGGGAGAGRTRSPDSGAAVRPSARPRHAGAGQPRRMPW